MAQVKPQVKKKREKTVTPVGRVSYPSLDKPDTGREFSDDKYKLTLLFPKEADLKPLKQAVANAAREEWGTDVDLKSLLLPFKDGDEKEDSAYHGHVFITVKSARKPGIIDAAKNVMAGEAVYGGCYARANVTAFPYTTNINVETADGKVVSKEKKGISFALNSVQFVRDGQPFGGSAENDFEDEVVDPFPQEESSGTKYDDDDLF